MKYTKLFLPLLLVNSTAQAADPMNANPSSPWYLSSESPGWHFDLGAGLESEPTYAGSKNSQSGLALNARATYRNSYGHRYFLGLGEVGATIPVSDNWQILAFLEYEEGRDADEEPLLLGLDPIDSTVEGQFTLAYRFGNASVFSTLQPDITGDANKGLVWFVGGAYDWLSDDESWRFNVTLDLSGADSEYMETEFGITPAESQRTAYSTYIPGSGLKSASLGFSGEYWLSENISLLGGLEIEQYLDVTKDSPLIRDVGDTTTMEGSVLVYWRF